MESGRITLSADRHSITLAHRLAKAEGTSISAMFVRYIRSRSRMKLATRQLGPLAGEASGMISVDAHRTDYRKLLGETLAKKHGAKP
jgi:hypothetical protein